MKNDERLEHLNKIGLSKEQINEMVKNADYVFNYTYGRFNPNNKNYKILTLVNDYIIIDDSGDISIEKNKDKTDKMWFDVNINMGAILKCSDETREIPHIKDSSKDEIILKVKDKSYLFSNKIDDKKYNNMYNNIVNCILRHLNDKNMLPEYEKYKQEDHVLIQNWFGKIQTGIDEKLIGFETGYVYEYHNKSGFSNKLENGIRIKKICRLHPILLSELRKFIKEELKIFESAIEDGTSLDRGTKISIKLEGKSIVINNADEYYTKISNKINQLLDDNDKWMKEISKN